MEEGIAWSSRHSPDPPLHILHPLGHAWATWCTGADAGRENTMRRRRCPACTKLLREGVEEEMYSPTELAEWLASTSSARRRTDR